MILQEKLLAIGIAPAIARRLRRGLPARRSEAADTVVELCAAAVAASVSPDKASEQELIMAFLFWLGAHPTNKFIPGYFPPFVEVPTSLSMAHHEWRSALMRMRTGTFEFEVTPTAHALQLSWGAENAEGLKRDPKLTVSDVLPITPRAYIAERTKLARSILLRETSECTFRQWGHWESLLFQMQGKNSPVRAGKNAVLFALGILNKFGMQRS